MGLNISRYAKRPVVIEAVQLTEANINAVAAWCGGHVEEIRAPHPGVGAGSLAHYLLVPTLEGVMRADLGWYVIKGVEGEFYPCKDSVFEATYEFVGYGPDLDQLELELDL